MTNAQAPWAPHPSLLAKFRASFLRLDAGDTDTESMDCDDAADAESPRAPKPPPRAVRSLVAALPAELLAAALALLDGESLLRAAAACRALRALSFDREVWRRLCARRWPSLRAQALPQLPGAPDYDVIRLYGGCWRTCFTEQHAREQRAEMSVSIPEFAGEAMLGVEKIVSDTFAIGSHRFCLWIFPNGNPNEPQYAGHVLSVYLVLTDLDQRPPDWLTCAVFSLAVTNHKNPADRIEWHSCLVDNKFDRNLNNWGVHALGALPALKDRQRGFLGLRDTLTVSASVRLMSITFRIVLESDLKAHHELGLVDLAKVDAVVLPFCCSLHDLLARLQELYDVDVNRVRLWCFNQPVVSGQALRPRKLLTADHVNRHAPMFGHLLCDGVDIDAYSFCQIYVEDERSDDAPLNMPSASVGDHLESMAVASAQISVAVAPESEKGAQATLASSDGDKGGYVFVKVLDPQTRRLEYIGRVYFASPSAVTSSALYEAAARRCMCSPADLIMFKEEIAPMTLSAPVPFSYECIGEISTRKGAMLTVGVADIVIFVARALADDSVAAIRALLGAQYALADELAGVSSDRIGEDPPFVPPPTLSDVEELAERLDIPKFRVRSAFRKCREDARSTLRYVMDGRHLGFICDSCGETDFRGTRYNCAECNDYDLCANCYGKFDISSPVILSFV